MVSAMGLYHFLLVGCCNNISILHHFQDTIPLFAVCMTVTVCDLGLAKSFTFENKVEITGNSCAFCKQFYDLKVLL